MMFVESADVTADWIVSLFFDINYDTSTIGSIFVNLLSW